MRAEEAGPVARLDARLQLVGLLLGDAPVLERLVDLVDRRRLRRVLELLEEIPRCFATESRNDDPGESVCDAAIAAPPPATASPATVAARTFFEVSLLMKSFRSLPWRWNHRA